MTGFAGLDYQAMLDDIPDPPTVVLLDTDGRARAGVLTVEGLAALGDRNPGGSGGRAVDPCGPGDMLYTSGTTGSPKGVLVSHDAVLRTAFASALTRAYEDGRRILFSLPCYHMFGYVEGLLLGDLRWWRGHSADHLLRRGLLRRHPATPGHRHPVRARRWRWR